MVGQAEIEKIGASMRKAIIDNTNERTAPANKKQYESIIATGGEELLANWKKAADAEAKKKHKEEQEEAPKAEGLPNTVKVYLTRLQKQNKEIYKNPSALPPDHIDIEEEKCPLPKRDKQTGELTFVCGQDKSIKHLLRDFKPNRTPEEIMRAGSFGGTYFRPIYSAVTNIKYNADDVLKDLVDPKW